MNEQQQMITDALRKMLSDHCTADVVDKSERGEFAATLWQVLEEAGLTTAGISESAGGAGGDLADSLLVIRESARFAAPLPLAEHFIAAWLLQNAGASVGAGPMTVAVGSFTLDAKGLVSGQAESVAFARWCQQLVLIAEGESGPTLCRVNCSELSISERNNIAGEPRDTVAADQVAAEQFQVDADIEQRLHLMGAATRSLMMVGALESTLELSVQYSLEREQFGRPISKFQAIQQQLAILAGEVAAATMAGHAISGSIEELDQIDIAIGKARIGEAVSNCTDIAHQVHGAMGYTMEHTLNHRTRRLWCWRDEFGAEREWQQLVGRNFASRGADHLWDSIVSCR